jgi:hypothetical protein
MFDLSALKQANQKIHTSDEKRHQKSLAYYILGRQYIKEAIDEQWNREKLTLAVDCFVAGIQHNYKNPSNYVGMAMMLMLIEQSKDAVAYLKMALEIAPNYKLAQALLAQYQSAIAPQRVSTNRPQPPAAVQQLVNAIDYDQLYDEVNLKIIEVLKTIMGENLHGLKPSLNVRDLKTLEIKYQSFHVLYVDLKKQIELVDEEIETTDLRKQLVPVEKSIQQMANLIEIFQQFMTLYEDIKQHQALTLTVISQSKEIHEQEDLSILEENLEVLLDHSDEVADHLDEIEKKGFSIQPLEKPYNSYIEELESFQDVLDETRQRLQERGV